MMSIFCICVSAWYDGVVLFRQVRYHVAGIGYDCGGCGALGPGGGEQEVAPDSGSAAGLDIARFIAQGERGGHIDAPAIAGAQEEPGRRFAVGVLQVGAMQDIEYGNPLLCKLPTQEMGEDGVVGLGIVAALDAGLVGHYHDVVARRHSRTAELDNTRHPLKILCPIDVALVYVYRPIAVEE